MAQEKEVDTKSTSNQATVLDTSLRSIPVFTIAENGTPVSVPFQKSEAEEEQVTMFFLDFDDAKELSYELELSDKKSPNSEVFSLSLYDFLIFMQEAQKQDVKVIFRPHRNSINQLKLSAKKKKLESMPQMMIPLFFARSKESMMSVVKDGKDVIPLFVDVSELQNTLRRNNKESEMEIDVEFLESLLAKASKNEIIKDQFMLVSSQCQSVRAEMLFRN